VPRAAAVIALACALSTAAGARDLFTLQAGGVTDSGHDVEGLLDDFLAHTGPFSALALQPGYNATLDYLGMPSAITMQASAFGNQVVLRIPTTGFSKTFTGTSPANVKQQVRDFFDGAGAHELARFLEKTNAHSKLAALDGNPRSTTAMFAGSAFDRFGIDSVREHRGSDEVAEVGDFDLGVRAGGGSLEASHFHPLRVANASLTLGGDLKRVGLYLSALGQYRNYDGADIYEAGLELGIPIVVAQPGGGDIPLRWTLTPVVQTGGSGSRDLLAGGFMVGGGCVSSFGWSLGGPFELTVADEMLYYGGVPLGTINGVRIDTELDQWITRNGIKLALDPPGAPWLSIEAGIKASHFLGSRAAVDSYATPFAGAAVKAFDLLRLRVGWESDFGKSGYAAHVGRLDLEWEF